MRSEYSLITAGIIVKIAAVYLFSLTTLLAQSADVQLNARLDKQKDQIYVGLRNTSNRTYLLSMGGLCGQYGAPGFRFSLTRSSSKEAMFLVYNQDPAGLVCGGPDPWVVTLTPGAEYGFTFALRALHFKNNFRASLADVTDARYTLIISYSGAIDSNFERNWKACQRFKTILFWQGNSSVTQTNSVSAGSDALCSTFILRPARPIRHTNSNAAQ